MKTGFHVYTPHCQDLFRLYTQWKLFWAFPYSLIQDQPCHISYTSFLPLVFLISQSSLILILLPIKDEMTTSLTYKSYDQVHLTGLAAEYEMIAEYEATSRIYDTSYYLDESHLPFINNESHFFFWSFLLVLWQLIYQ